MTKGRATVKYGVTGAITALFGLAIVRAKTHPVENTSVDFRKVAIVSGAVIGSVWVIAVL